MSGPRGRPPEPRHQVREQPLGRPDRVDGDVLRRLAAPDGGAHPASEPVLERRAEGAGEHLLRARRSRPGFGNPGVSRDQRDVALPTWKGQRSAVATGRSARSSCGSCAATAGPARTAPRSTGHPRRSRRTGYPGRSRGAAPDLARSSSEGRLRTDEQIPGPRRLVATAWWSTPLPARRDPGPARGRGPGGGGLGGRRHQPATAGEPARERFHGVDVLRLPVPPRSGAWPDSSGRTCGSCRSAARSTRKPAPVPVYVIIVESHTFGDPPGVPRCLSPRRAPSVTCTYLTPEFFAGLLLVPRVPWLLRWPLAGAGPAC